MASERIRGLETRAGRTLGGFRAFILRGNVVDLAVAIVIGTAFTAVVTAFVSDIITPIIPTSGGSLSKVTYTIPGTNDTLLIGDFINKVLSFLIIAAVVYFFVVLPVTSLMARFKPKEVEAPPSTRDCPYCLSSIPLMATRCPDCTSQVQPPPPAQGAPGAR